MPNLLVNECVIDSELINNHSAISPDECVSFGNLLHEILNHETKLVVNDNIFADYYGKQIRQSPPKIKLLINQSLKRKKCHRKVENVNLDGEILVEFINTPLYEKYVISMQLPKVPIWES